MKMSEKTLLKKIEQAFKENCCNGSYKLELENEYNDYTYYVLSYTYETGETIALDIVVSWLGEVKFYSPVHCYYISNFNNHTKSVINVLRMLFDMVDSNKADMINYAIKTEEPEETEELENAECAKGNDVFEGCKKSIDTIIAADNEAYKNSNVIDTDVLQPNKTIIAKIEKTSLPCLTCKHFCVRYDNERIKMTHCVRKNTENYLKAVKNPNWHNVSLKTVANIDNDMLDEKRQFYMYLYCLLKDFRKYAFEISRREVYFDLVRSVIKEIQQGYFNNKISIKAYNYACRHIESVGVEKNYFTSYSEKAFGYKESKRYKITLR
jgi:hypothetical protein